MNFVKLAVTPLSSSCALVWMNQASAKSGKNAGTLTDTMVNRSKELKSAGAKTLSLLDIITERVTLNIYSGK